MHETIRITVNGVEREVAAGTTVAGVLALLGAAKGRVAVERNCEVIPRYRHERTRLTAGDRIEVVAFVGGG
jgi:thiamine biosynthesis protein ThiS